MSSIFRFTRFICSRRTFQCTMADQVPLILRLIAVAIPAANNAGKIIREVMKKGELNIVDKGIKDYQTEADRAAHIHIGTSLSCHFPNITVIGEEDSAESTAADFQELIKTPIDNLDQTALEQTCPDEFKNLTEKDITVWVDPLDGTSEYTQGLLEHVTVLIGIAVNKKAIAGIIHQPYFGYKENKEATGRTIWALHGLGTFGFEANLPPADRRIITTTRSHLSDSVQKAIDAMEPDEVVKVGGAGHKVLLLLEGKAHAYIFASKGTKRWDTCAPEAVLHAFGGLLTDMHGDFYSYDKSETYENVGGVLATAKKEEHSKYFNLIPQEIKNILK